MTYIINEQYPNLKPRLHHHIFNTPKILSTIGINESSVITDGHISAMLDRHFSGMWGGISSDGQTENNRSLKNQGMLISEYHCCKEDFKIRYSKSEKSIVVWIITDPGWKTTTILLPEEY